MKKLVAGVVGVLVGALGGANAHADGFAEAIVGVAAPIGDDTYDDAVDASFRVGFRVGSLALEPDEPGLGFEVGADWTPLSSDIDVFMNESFHRVRVMGGVRLVYPATDGVRVTGRFAAGIDYTRATVGGEVFGVEFESTETDVGFALDPSLAVQAVLGTSAVGLQIGVPIGIHDEQGDEFDIDYTSVDLDILLVVTGTM